MHAQPFRPFSLQLADGSVCTVEHPDFIAVPPGNRPHEIAFFSSKGGDDYETHWIDLFSIIAVIVGSQAQAEPAETSAEGNGA